MFSYISPEQRVPADHPLWPIRRPTDAALAAMSPRFALLYSNLGRAPAGPTHARRASFGSTSADGNSHARKECPK
jgi:hypothetical protein